jgi:hypothetical protein
MAPWGWLALLAIPGWLLWITGVGYSVVKACVEGTDTGVPANTPAAKRACHDLAPAAWAPFRGVRFGTDAWTGEYWVGGLVAALLFAVVVVLLARRAGRVR